MVDEGRYIVPPKYVNAILAIAIVSRLLEVRRRFEAMGAQNEECSEYVLSVLNYITGDTPDDPTADWLKYPYG